MWKHPNEPSEDPDAPKNLTESDVTGSSIKLSWDSVSYEEGIEEYEVYRNGSSVDTRKGTSFSDKDLDEDTTYEYEVKAIAENGQESELSEKLSVTTESSDGDD